MAELGEKVGAQASTINKLEKGRMRLTQDWMMRLSSALGIPVVDLLDAPGSKDARPVGNVEPYTPKPGHYLSASGQHAFYKVTTAELDQHPERLEIGTVLVVDASRQKWADVAPGDVVVVEMRDAASANKKPPAILAAQFLPPNKLMSNSRGDNWIMAIDDPDLNFEPILIGTLSAAVRGS